MIQDENKSGTITSEPPQNSKSSNLIDQMKSGTRDELISRLVSLLNAAFQKGHQTKASPQVQQRWFTITGYLSQVLARVVRDLEYEKLRADVDDLKRQVSNKVVITPRRTVATTRNRASATKPID